MRSRLGRNVLLGIGGALAALAVTVGRGEHSSVKSSVGAVALATPVTTKVTETVTGDLLPPARRPVADPNAVLLLEKMEREGDRYVAPMSDGRTAVLTIDPRLQDAAERVLNLAKAPKGAIVVTDADGRVLALAGRRTEDPKGGKDGIVDRTLALQAWAPAASIFK